MKVMLVDDERIALEHVRSMIDWQAHGFEIAGTATNGRSALRLCGELRPAIMIVDIRMPVMDGLALIEAVVERQYGVKFIVMSAHEDFEYARQAIALGDVSGYLVKHEAGGGKLLEELDKARRRWEADERRRRLERSDWLRDAVARGSLDGIADGRPAGPPFAMLLLQRDMPFRPLPEASPARPARQPSAEQLPAPELPSWHGWEPVGAYASGAHRHIVLLSWTGAAPHAPADAAHALARACRERLSGPGPGDPDAHSCSCFYSLAAVRESELPRALRAVEAAARHSIFAGPGAVLCADELPLPAADDADREPLRRIRPDELASGLRHNDFERVETAVKSIFDRLIAPTWDLPGLHEAVLVLSGLYRDRRAAAGLAAADPLGLREAGELYHIRDIRDRFILAMRGLQGDDVRPELLPGKLLAALRYIHAHYSEDINIEDVSYATGISASYLHHLFKRELGRTFLDYVTERRIKQAKLILLHEDAKMTEVAARVGYRSPQHFSQVFKRVAGMPPHRFRELRHR